MTGREVSNLLVLWTLMIPELSKAAKQVGATTPGENRAVIPTSAPVPGMGR